MSLRGRILAALLVVMAAGLAAADIATFQALRTFLVQRIDAQLDSLQRPIIARLFRPQGDLRLSGEVAPLEDGVGVFAQVRDSSGQVLVTLQDNAYGTPQNNSPRITSLPQPPQCGASFCTASVSFETPGSSGAGYQVHVWSLPEGDGTLLVALPMTDLYATLGRLLLIEILVSLAVLAGAAGLGLYLVRLGLRPLNEIEATAGAIAGGDLSRRVRRAEPRTEVGRLGLALNAMLGQIEVAFTEKEASEQRLRRFLADASHELRTPLTSIRGYAELFRRGARERPADLAKAMERIEAESSRMGVMVEDLLLLARLDQGRGLVTQAVDLSAVVEAAADAAQVVEPDRPLEVRLERNVIVEGEADRLRQVVDNLLANVRTHTPHGSPASVTLSLSDGRAVLEVADHGPGLPPQGREQIFERFHRADPSRSRDRGGAGLGLAIVAAIVAAHGGRVMAADRPGGGALFRVDLPARASSAPAA